jgi:aspartate/methionine/tyrosine aminotransferase
MIELDFAALDPSDLLKRHSDLEALYGDGGNGNFLSGWQCDNPRSGDLQKWIAIERAKLDDSRYQYLDGDLLIEEGFREFHRSVDGMAPNRIFCAEGSSSLIFTFCTWLKSKGIAEVFYIPPLYFSAHFALRLLGIRARPISGRHAFEKGFTINLPAQTATLLLSDPVWYAGISLGRATVDRIIEWQRLTQSFVFVDGSFQYMRWNGTVVEPTSQLSADHTIRVICPTKALALHGYRFAYATIPTALRPEFAHIYANLYGSASTANVAFGRVAATIGRARAITTALVNLASDRHRELRSAGRISADWEAECGYFIFERIMADLSESPPLMDGSFFEQKRYPDHWRINLLSPSIGMLR